MVTMVDVARMAGVSVKTVSRVVNEEPYVQDQVRTRVRTAILELGYVPSASARTLRSRRSYTLALMSHTDISNYVNAIQFGATLACQAQGYQMRVVLTEPEDRRDEVALTRLLDQAFPNGDPEGVILVAPLSGDPIVDAVFRKRNIRAVRIGPLETGLEGMNVGVDEREASEELVKRLIALGHRRIGFIRGREDQTATKVRYEGYVRALKAAGIGVKDELVVPGVFMFDSGRVAGARLLDLAERPTAIFAANDDMAAGVIAEARLRGIDVPSQLSVVGFDDSEIAEKMQPALTTVRQPLLEFGQTAVNCLVEAITRDVDPFQVVHLDYRLIERDSHAAAPGKPSP